MVGLWFVGGGEGGGVGGWCGLLCVGWWCWSVWLSCGGVWCWWGCGEVVWVAIVCVCGVVRCGFVLGYVLGWCGGKVSGSVLRGGLWWLAVVSFPSRVETLVGLLGGGGGARGSLGGGAVCGAGV